MKETPMIKQFLGFKKQYPENIVLFRMGDFFETFGEDAKITSKILNITLTSRDKKADPTPLAGFPHHALNQYLPKLVKAGHYVVVVDQTEDPKFAKGIVKRDIIRVVTPGTLGEHENEYVKNINLVSLKKIKGMLGIAIIDISTGNLQIYDCEYSKGNIDKIFSSCNPAEILLGENENIPVGNYPVQFLGKDDYEKIIKEFYSTKTLDSLNLKTTLPSSYAVGMLLKYILETQKIKPAHISKPMSLKLDGTMYLDSSTIRNLDLVFNTATNSTEGTLLSVLSETKTNMGKRMLYTWILNPLLDYKEISKRLSIVEYFVNNFEILHEVRNILSMINDIERIIGKMGLSRVNAKDYRALEDSLNKSQELYLQLNELNEKYNIFSENGSLLKKLSKRIDQVIINDPPTSITEGNIINNGYDEKVDELRKISGSSKSWVQDFAKKEKERTGIGNLKIGFNKIFGYYIEVSKANQSKVPDEYIRKQTLVSSERYITEELKVKEDEILNAEGKLSEIELKIFEEFKLEVLPYIEQLKKLSFEISYLDVLEGFAYCAMCNEFIKPEIFEIGKEEKVIEIKESRHPVIEMISDEEFISNDIFLNEKSRRMNILTGPNMSGKSTYIRQVALIVLMAQIGSFVPAKSAKISMVDRIFTRVGASDDLIRGRSTFMVEMDEAANIVNNASENSLVILDEIGRGTSTYDGVSIAWSLAEYLINVVKVRTMFATHYHELLTLGESHLDFVTNLNVQVDENEDSEEVVFLRKIIEGGTDRSYGIYVAKLAGLPDEVINRAKEILSSFEQTSMFGRKNMDIPILKREEPQIDSKEDCQQLSFFDTQNKYLLDEISNLDLDSLTPLEVLNKVSEWKKNIS